MNEKGQRNNHQPSLIVTQNFKEKAKLGTATRTLKLVVAKF